MYVLTFFFDLSPNQDASGCVGYVCFTHDFRIGFPLSLAISYSTLYVHTYTHTLCTVQLYLPLSAEIVILSFFHFLE